jgi:UDP-glucose 4-epimerase
MKVLVVGGAGYIGSHTVLELLCKNYEVAVFDSFENGHNEALEIVQKITSKELSIFKGNLLNILEIRNAIETFKPDCVIQFAAYIEVGESVKDPLKYYGNNVIGGLNLLAAMGEFGVNKIVFSSTAAVFGQPDEVPIKESTTKSPINPYGSSKYMFEQILNDSSKAYGMNYVALRYFNACGCEMDGHIGEDHAPESHLIPLIMDAALGKRESIGIYGTDYETRDGTCIRDYVHVLDLAEAHIKAIEFMVRENKSDVFNLGSSEGYSVREIIDEVKKVSGKEFKVIESDRRAGDPAVLVADNQKAKEVLGWEIRYNLEAIIESAWKWETGKGRYEY